VFRTVTALRLQHASAEVPEVLIEVCGDFSAHVMEMQRIPHPADRIRGGEPWFVRDPAGNLVQAFAVAPRVPA